MIPEVHACSIPVPYRPALPHQPDISTERRGPEAGPADGHLRRPSSAGSTAPPHR